ncbi:SIR2 family protein [candidate division KSB1 bacterium]|nr:SIR2 family protein [candidate division KSB1 bacterium]
MNTTILHHPDRELKELRSQLAYTKRIGFLFGAGTSKAAGLPDLHELTHQIEQNLSEPHFEIYQRVKNNLSSQNRLNISIESIINQIRLIRQVTGENRTVNFDGIDGKSAINLDNEICNNIYQILSRQEPNCSLNATQKFVAWISRHKTNFPMEIFTTNYDLIFEKAFESLQIPYFDGFIGSNQAFFYPEAIESASSADCPPRSWLRLWKLHGSLNWFWKPGTDSISPRIIRVNQAEKYLSQQQELVIYPSREKYEASRKQPFLAFFDRLKSWLLAGDGLLLVAGYSFSDEHINELLFSGLKLNKKLHLIGFCYSDEVIEKVMKNGIHFLNLTLLGPGQALLRGMKGTWMETQPKGPVQSQFWDRETRTLKLGNFNELVKFLLYTSGQEEKFEYQLRLSHAA